MTVSVIGEVVGLTCHSHGWFVAVVSPVAYKAPSSVKAIAYIGPILSTRGGSIETILAAVSALIDCRTTGVGIGERVGDGVTVIVGVAVAVKIGVAVGVCVKVAVGEVVIVGGGVWGNGHPIPGNNHAPTATPKATKPMSAATPCHAWSRKVR